MSAEVHVGDIGTEIRIDITNQDNSIVDVSNATNIVVIIEKPNGVILSVSAELYTDGTDGIISYFVVDGDLDVAGMYKIQARVSFSIGEYSSDIHTVRVYKNLN